MSPTQIPDFYGYGSDIEVSLTTGRTVYRTEPLPARWHMLWIVPLAVLMLPYYIVTSMRHPNRYRGQIECDR